MHRSTRPSLRLQQLDGRIMPAQPGAMCAMGAGVGMAPIVRVYDEQQNTVVTVVAYDMNFLGGVRVAMGDVTGDGVDDLITAAGTGGGPHIKVFDGNNAMLVRSFFAYDPAFRGGVFVATGDVNGDGRTDIITGPGQGGGAHIKTFSGVDNSELKSFFAYDPAFRGGATVATGDFNGDGIADIVTGAGPGGGPHVQAFDGPTTNTLLSFMAYDSSFSGGVFVATGHMAAGDARSSIITGAGAGGGPHVKVFDAAGDVTQSFMAYNPSFTGGVRVTACDYGDLGHQIIVTSAGQGAPQEVLGINPTDRSVLFHFFPFNLEHTGGIFVG
jgi:hypothetical protein